LACEGGTAFDARFNELHLAIWLLRRLAGRSIEVG